MYIAKRSNENEFRHNIVSIQRKEQQLPDYITGDETSGDCDV